MPRGALKTRAIIAEACLAPLAASGDCYRVRATFLTSVKGRTAPDCPFRNPAYARGNQDHTLPNFAQSSGVGRPMDRRGAQKKCRLTGGGACTSVGLGGRRPMPSILAKNDVGMLTADVVQRGSIEAIDAQRELRRLRYFPRIAFRHAAILATAATGRSTSTFTSPASTSPEWPSSESI